MGEVYKSRNRRLWCNFLLGSVAGLGMLGTSIMHMFPASSAPSSYSRAEARKVLAEYREATKRALFFRSVILLVIPISVTVSLLWIGVRRFNGKLEIIYTLQFRTIFPEECIAELVVLRQRMEKSNVSSLDIHLRLLQEYLVLFWGFYIQIKIENLWLPSGDRQPDN